MDIQEIKQRFSIIGNAPGLNRAIEVALQVAPTDLSVLISGESGVGKESFPRSSIIIRHENMANTSPSTAVQSRKGQSTQSFLDMKKDHLQERSTIAKVTLR